MSDSPPAPSSDTSHDLARYARPSAEGEATFVFMRHGSWLLHKLPWWVVALVAIVALALCVMWPQHIALWVMSMLWLPWQRALADERLYISPSQICLRTPLGRDRRYQLDALRANPSLLQPTGLGLVYRLMPPPRSRQPPFPLLRLAEWRLIDPASGRPVPLATSWRALGLGITPFRRHNHAQWTQAAQARQRAIATLPVPAVLAHVGVPLPQPNLDTNALMQAGLLRLEKVPSIRRALIALALSLALIAFFTLQHLKFVAFPVGLAIALCLLSFAAMLWLGYPRAAQLKTVADQASASQQARAAALIAALIAAPAWMFCALSLALLLNRSEPQLAHFSFHPSRLNPPGAAQLRSQTPGVPDIWYHSRASYWQRQREGRIYQFPVRQGPFGLWWQFDEREALHDLSP